MTQTLLNEQTYSLTESGGVVTGGVSRSENVGVSGSFGTGSPFSSLATNKLADLIYSKGFNKQAWRFAKCGELTDDWISCGCDTGVYRVRRRCEYYRICPTCGGRRFKKVRNAYINPILENCKVANRWNAFGLRMLTLTIENCEVLSDGVKHIKESFYRLRKTEYFKRRVKGGMFCIEPQPSRFGRGWHVHAHVLIESAYLGFRKRAGDNSRFIEEWSKASRQVVSVCDVRLVSNGWSALNYVLKYVTKSQIGITPEQGAEIFSVMYRKKLVFPFGSFYKFKKGEGVRVCSCCGCRFVFISEVEINGFGVHKVYKGVS